MHRTRTQIDDQPIFEIISSLSSVARWSHLSSVFCRCPQGWPPVVAPFEHRRKPLGGDWFLVAPKRPPPPLRRLLLPLVDFCTEGSHEQPEKVLFLSDRKNKRASSTMNRIDYSEKYVDGAFEYRRVNERAALAVSPRLFLHWRLTLSRELKSGGRAEGLCANLLLSVGAIFFLFSFFFKNLYIYISTSIYNFYKYNNSCSSSSSSSMIYQVCNFVFVSTVSDGV